MLLPVHGAANAVSHKFKESKASSMGEMPTAQRGGSNSQEALFLFEREAYLAKRK